MAGEFTQIMTEGLHKIRFIYLSCLENVYFLTKLNSHNNV
jgi:hypothetical protein